MTDNELKLARLITHQNMVLTVSTTILVISLFAWSGSFYSLWGLLMMTAYVSRAEVTSSKEGTE